MSEKRRERKKQNERIREIQKKRLKEREINR